MDEVAIKVENLYKSFKIPHEKNSSLKSAALNALKFKRKTYTQYDAANGIHFEVKRGEFFGIIGRNGCGKSTMLKMISGIYLPDKGKITINGKISPFLELGVGFNPELTGRENIYLNGTILGLSRKEIDEKFEEIIKFAELEEFVDQKLKRYSSGMQVRLGFSVATHAHAEILLIDEVLAVGDSNFQKKCFDTFEKFKAEGKTIVFVTHSMASVRDFCDRVAVFDHGEIKYLGDPNIAIDKYNKLNVEKISKKGESELGSALGNGGAEVIDFKMLNAQGKEIKYLETMQKFTIQLKVKFNKSALSPAFAIMFRKNPTENLFGINSYYSNKISVKKGETVKVTFESSMPLAPDSYFLTVAVSDQPKESFYEDYIVLNNYYKVNVDKGNSQESFGLVASDYKIDVSKEPNGISQKSKKK